MAIMAVGNKIALVVGYPTTVSNGALVTKLMN
jgi:hypothetical protein